MAVAVVGQFELVAADAQHVAVAERDRRQRPFGIVGARQQLSGLLVRDDGRPPAQAGRAADVVGVRVAVDQVGDRLVGDFGNRLRNCRGDGGRRVHDHHAGFVNEEHRLVDVLGDHVEVSAEHLDAIALRRIDRRALGCLRHVQVLADAHAGRRNAWHVLIGRRGRLGAGLPRQRRGRDGKQHHGGAGCEQPCASKRCGWHAISPLVASRAAPV